MPLYWLAFPSREPLGTANGVYANACCGEIELRNGLMIVGHNQYIKYVVERDKVGPHVVPEAYIGASKSGFVIRRAGYPLVLRVEEGPHPRRIALIDDVSGEVFSFDRVNGG